MEGVVAPDRCADVGDSPRVPASDGTSGPRADGRAGPISKRIVLTAGQSEPLSAGFANTWQRPPTDAELKGLIDDWIREEIAVREAMAAGLDRDDTVIRRRLRQKLEFLTGDPLPGREDNEGPPTGTR